MTTIEAELYAAFDPCNIPQRLTDRSGRLLPGFVERLDLLLAWSLLPEPAKTCILLRYRDHLGAASIGRRLRCDAETVREMLADGLAQIERRVEVGAVDLLGIAQERAAHKWALKRDRWERVENWVLTRPGNFAIIELRRRSDNFPAHGPGEIGAQAREV